MLLSPLESETGTAEALKIRVRLGVASRVPLCFLTQSFVTLTLIAICRVQVRMTRHICGKDRARHSYCDGMKKRALSPGLRRIEVNTELPSEVLVPMSYAIVIVPADETCYCS